MKTLKTIALVTIFIATFNVANAQDTNAQTDTEAVIGVMKTYKDAIQNLTTAGTFSLFAGRFRSIRVRRCRRYLCTLHRTSSWARIGRI